MNEPAPKPFHLPERNTTNDYVIRYLTGCGIHAEVVRQCIRRGILYESMQCNNCVFVGLDPEGTPRYAAIRGTLGTFRAEAAGSVKRYGFTVPLHLLDDSCTRCSELAIFESPIDLLSHISLSPRENVQRLALGGASSKALMQYIADHPEIRTIHACLDNDEAGCAATQKLRAMLPNQYHFIDCPPLEGKDYNDFLLLTQHRDRQQARRCAVQTR